MHFRTVALGTFILLAAAEASAQTCLGLPSFDDAPYQGFAGAGFTDGAQRFGAGAAIGSESVFAGAGLGFTNFSEADSNATTFMAHVGANYTFNTRDRITACPLLAVAVTTGPDIGDVDVHGVGLTAGGRLGIVAAETGNIEIVPTFGLDIAYDRLTGDVGDVRTTLSRETYGIVRVGVGFVLNKWIGFVPALSVPLGLDGADPEFSFDVALNWR